MYKRQDYSHIGTSVTPIQDGMVIYDNDKLYRYSKGIYDVVCENPVFKFDFSKYIERYSMPTPDIVSILFGANEFQICSYSELDVYKRQEYILRGIYLPIMLKAANCI